MRAPVCSRTYCATRDEPRVPHASHSIPGRIVRLSLKRVTRPEELRAAVASSELEIAPHELPLRPMRHVLLNFSGMIIPLGAAFILLPVAARALGPARFGILSLGWALTEYLGLLEFGVGRASIRFVASALSRNAFAELRQTISTSLLAQLLLGSLGAIAISWLAPLLAHRVFDVPAALVPEAISTFYAVAVNLPIVLLLGGLRAVLEGASRFDLSVAVRLPSSVAAVLIPAVGATIGASLPAIFLWLAIVRLAACAVALMLVRQSVAGPRWLELPSFRRAKRLWTFSAWAAISGVCSPTLVYLERFALAAAVGVTAVGFYTAPYEATTRFLLIPIGIAGVLYPLLTRAHDRSAQSKTAWATGASMRYILAIIGFPMGLLVALAPEILTYWMGVEFAEQGTVALRVLAVGVVINGIAHPPYIALYAANRPDIVARNHLLELVLYVPIVWQLTMRFGISGAAWAWTLRATLDALLLLWGVHRVVGLRQSDVFPSVLVRSAAIPLVVVAALAVTAGSARSATTWVVIATVGAAAYALAIWLSLLTAAERRSIRGALWSFSELKRR